MNQTLRHQQAHPEAVRLSSARPRVGTRRTTWWVAAFLSLFVVAVPAIAQRAVDNGLLWLEVTRSGVQRITYEQMNAAGLNLAGVDANAIAVTNLGKSVPVRVGKDANAAKKFGAGWYLEFLGEGLDTLYTKANVYQLYLDKARATRVQGDGTNISNRDTPAPFYMETVRVAKEVSWSFVSPTGDPWYMAQLHAYAPGFTANFPLAVDGYAGPVAPVKLAVGLWGYNDWPDADNDHHVRVSLNGTLLADEVFDGITARSVGAAVPPGTLREGSNTLTIGVPLDTGQWWDLVNLDHYAVTYPRQFKAKAGEGLTFAGAGKLFEVSGLASDKVVVYRRKPDGTVAVLEKAQVAKQANGTYNVKFPGLATEATYVVTTVTAMAAPKLSPPPEDVDITSGPAKYLVIAHPDFIGPDQGGFDALAVLAAERRSEGLSVLVADVEQVYAQFGYGIVDPDAIRDYIAYAKQNMGTEMVLLVGGDTLDYHGYFVDGSGAPRYDAVSFIPSLYAPTGPFVNVAPVDPLYADVDGDNIPDLAIGRFPVRTSAELRQMVEKTLAWQRRDYKFSSVFVADAYDSNNRHSFKADSEDMLSRLPVAWSGPAVRAYVDDQGVAGARRTLIDNLNAGMALTSFVGHSDTNIWTFNGLFSGTDARNLTNRGRPTLLTQWGCWNTFYVSPRENTLGHEFLLNGAQGAAAVLGASTLTEAAHERQLAKHVYDRLFKPGVTLGQAVHEAKRAYAASGTADADVILGWTLLGDPGLVTRQ